MFEPAKISDILYGIANSRDQELDLLSNILHLLSDIASVTSVTSFLKFLYNKYIHLHPNVFSITKVLYSHYTHYTNVLYTFEIFVKFV